MKFTILIEVTRAFGKMCIMTIAQNKLPFNLTVESKKLGDWRSLLLAYLSVETPEEMREKAV